MPSSEVRGALKGVDFPVNCRQRRTSVDDGEEVHKRGSVCVCVCVCVREGERAKDSCGWRWFDHDDDAVQKCKG